MKKGILLFVIGLIFSTSISYANWLPESTVCTQYNASTFNSGTLVVPKFEGKFKYCVKQELLENPYSGGTIVFDGVNYNFTNASGVTSSLGSSVPNQAQFLGNYTVAEKIYWYDKTPPISCNAANGKVYYGELPSVPPLVPYLGGWSNQELFGRITCVDNQPAALIKTALGDIIPVGTYTIFGGDVYSDLGVLMTGYTVIPSTTVDISGCQQSEYDTIAVHGSSGVLLTMRDNAGNQDTRYCAYNYTVMKDAYPPRISVQDEAGSYLDAIEDPTFQSGTMLATGSTSFTITLEDTMDAGSAASGIKSYSATITRIADHLGDPVAITPPVCSLPMTMIFPPFPIDPTGAYDIPDIKTIPMICNSDPSFKKTGTYRVIVTAEDIAENIRIFTSEIVVYPNPDIHIDEVIGTVAPVNSDGVSPQTYTAYVRDIFNNPVPNYPVSNILYTSSANIHINEVTSVGNALFVKNAYGNTTASDGLLTIQMVSVAPGNLFTGFKFAINKWTDVDSFKNFTGVMTDYTFGDGTESRIFTRPYTATFGIDPAEIILGYTHTGNLTVVPDSYAPAAYTVYNFTSSLGTLDAGLTLTSKFAHSRILTTFTPEQVGPTILDFKLTTHPYATYFMSGYSITAYIGAQPIDPASALIVSGNTGAINRIAILGNKQTVGKEGYVTNISDIGSSSIVAARNIIRKNIYIAIRGRNPDLATTPSPKIVNGIKYIKGDYTITSAEASTRNWETLFVIDGNVTIDTDSFNLSNKKVAIMVLKSDPNSSKGNLYITPDVKYISSLIYTDGSIMSVDASGSLFAAMDSVRSSALQNQLVLKGVFISRNTIGGAVLGSTLSGAGAKMYTLPGGVGSDDLALAAGYDLSFLRSSNIGYDNPLATQPYNQGNDAFTVVLYDAQYLQASPPGFSMKP